MHFENSNELIFYYILQYLRKNRPLLLGVALVPFTSLLKTMARKVCWI